MTNPTLERAARAAHEERRGAGFDLFDDCGWAEQEAWRDVARAVLMAVREPSPKMVNATWNHPIDRDGGFESQNTRNERVYTAMIDAILNDGEGE